MRRRSDAGHGVQPAQHQQKRYRAKAVPTTYSCPSCPWTGTATMAAVVHELTHKAEVASRG